jgi:hypothetical protein
VIGYWMGGIPHTASRLGLHEGELTVDYVKVGVRKVETMINEAKGDNH